MRRIPFASLHPFQSASPAGSSRPFKIRRSMFDVRRSSFSNFAVCLSLVVPQSQPGPANIKSLLPIYFLLNYRLHNNQVGPPRRGVRSLHPVGTPRRGVHLHLYPWDVSHRGLSAIQNSTFNVRCSTFAFLDRPFWPSAFSLQPF